MLGFSWGDHEWDITRAMFEEAWFAMRREYKVKDSELRTARIRQN